jgi:hypothetical protein
VLIKENLEAASIAVPIDQEARVTVERDLVKRQYRGTYDPVRGKWVGEPIGGMEDLNVLTGMRSLKSVLLHGAELFCKHRRQQGIEPLQRPEEMLVRGPFQHRPLTTGRPTQGGAGVIHGWREGEDQYPDRADFVILGRFLSTHGKVVEPSNGN